MSHHTLEFLVGVGVVFIPTIVGVVCYLVIRHRRQELIDYNLVVLENGSEGEILEAATHHEVNLGQNSYDMFVPYMMWRSFSPEVLARFLGSVLYINYRYEHALGSEKMKKAYDVVVEESFAWIRKEGKRCAFFSALVERHQEEMAPFLEEAIARYRSRIREEDERQRLALAAAELSPNREGWSWKR